MPGQGNPGQQAQKDYFFPAKENIDIFLYKAALFNIHMDCTKKMYLLKVKVSQLRSICSLT
jgi:hypothetical protein